MKVCKPECFPFSCVHKFTYPSGIWFRLASPLSHTRKSFNSHWDFSLAPTTIIDFCSKIRSLSYAEWMKKIKIKNVCKITGLIICTNFKRSGGSRIKPWAEWSSYLTCSTCKTGFWIQMIKLNKNLNTFVGLQNNLCACIYSAGSSALLCFSGSLSVLLDHCYKISALLYVEPIFDLCPLDFCSVWVIKMS